MAATSDKMQMCEGTGGGRLGAIPLVDAGEDWVFETLRRHERHCHGFLDAADRLFPQPLLRTGDWLTRKWLARSDNPYRREIETLVAMLGRTGVYTYNLAYEWACLGGVGTDITGTRTRFLRVLDYRLRGVGRHLVAVRIRSAAGPWATVTWPGYAGIVQGVAPGRFAGCMNQPPSRVRSGLRPADWCLNHVKIWQSRSIPPEYLLRDVFETASSYGEARHRLATTPIARPTIYVLAGLEPNEGCVIERSETAARILDGNGSAGNDWVSDGWSGYRRTKRRGPKLPASAFLGPAGDFAWLKPPFCSWQTRLVLAAEPATGFMVVQGREGRRAATEPLQVDIGNMPAARHAAAPRAKRALWAYRTTTLAPTGTL